MLSRCGIQPAVVCESAAAGSSWFGIFGMLSHSISLGHASKRVVDGAVTVIKAVRLANPEVLFTCPLQVQEAAHKVPGTRHQVPVLPV